jgi:predicted nucleotidyltransferase
MQAMKKNEIVNEIVSRLVKSLGPERVYLFGSQARDQAGSHSDFDILVVVPHSDLSGHRRDVLALRALRGLRAAVDVLVLTTEEFESRLDVVCSLPATVVREGTLLYAAA